VPGVCASAAGLASNRPYLDTRRSEIFAEIDAIVAHGAGRDWAIRPGPGCTRLVDLESLTALSQAASDRDGKWMNATQSWVDDGSRPRPTKEELLPGLLKETSQGSGCVKVDMVNDL